MGTANWKHSSVAVSPVFHYTTSNVGRSPAVARRSWLKWLLIGIVVCYIGVIVLAPLIGLLAGAFAGGLEPIVAALQYQQRDHMERGIEYARKVLGLGVKSA